MVPAADENVDNLDNVALKALNNLGMVAFALADDVAAKHTISGRWRSVGN